MQVAEFGGAEVDHVRCHAARVQQRARGRVSEVEGEVAVANGVEAVRRQPLEAQQLTHDLAIDGKRSPGQGADPERHLG